MRVKRIVTVKMPTRFGSFRLVAYQNGHPDWHHLALIKGKVSGHDGTLVRIHSSCFTGDVLGSLRCDCGEQLEKAMAMIEREGVGVVLYLFQEGRGIGLVNKLRAYELQENGLDTVEANQALGLPDDARSYEVAAEILADLGVKKIRLLTNNPQKAQQLVDFGIDVVSMVPIVVAPTLHNIDYLRTKKEKMGHLLKF